jgi:NAD(P)-dependent dehydrogenase (short-subunit alcohol dehydrogenase family)
LLAGLVDRMRTTAQELEGIDILVNNAVNSVPGTFLELSDEAWLNHISVESMGCWTPFILEPGAVRT